MLSIGEDNRMLVVNSAIKNKVSRDVIDLYEELNIAIDLMENNDFEIIDSSIMNDAVRFEITTQNPKGLPENLGILFFNTNMKFKIDIKITRLGKHNGLVMKYYTINLKKY